MHQEIITKFNLLKEKQLSIDITRGNLDPLPIAISPLSLDDKSKNDFKNQLNVWSFSRENILQYHPIDDSWNILI